MDIVGKTSSQFSICPYNKVDFSNFWSIQ